MIALEIQILIAVVLDYILGDPRSFPHPVRLIGSLASLLEPLFRKWINNLRLAGLFTVLTVFLATGITVLSFLNALALIHPLAQDIGSIFILYTTFAFKDLRIHSLSIFHALKQGNLLLARTQVGKIVGRDTSKMTPEEITRASIESVAENTVDGLIAPLFYATLAGPFGAILYKAASTLDSTFGYKNKRYEQFGWAAARIDDALNLLPSRLAALGVFIVASLLGYSANRGYSIFIRDRNKHSSPNAGQIESAIAGALGIQLGGQGVYFGKIVNKPLLGDPIHQLSSDYILYVNKLMLANYILFVFIFLTIRSFVFF